MGFSQKAIHTISHVSTVVTVACGFCYIFPSEPLSWIRYRAFWIKLVRCSCPLAALSSAEVWGLCRWRRPMVWHTLSAT